MSKLRHPQSPILQSGPPKQDILNSNSLNFAYSAADPHLSDHSPVPPHFSVEFLDSFMSCSHETTAQLVANSRSLIKHHLLMNTSIPWQIQSYTGNLTPWSNRSRQFSSQGETWIFRLIESRFLFLRGGIRLGVRIRIPPRSPSFPPSLDLLSL
jgi:hypothetical protein